MKETTRIALLAFFCGGLLCWLVVQFALPLLAPPPLAGGKPLTWGRRVDQFKLLQHKPKLVFLGDSRIEEGLWSEWLHQCDVSNRGIAGDTTSWLLERLPVSVSGATGAVIVQLGVNDLMRGDSAPPQIVSRFGQILDYLRRKSPKVIVTSVIYARQDQELLNHQITALNRDFRALCTQKKLVWVDLNGALAPGGYLDPSYTNDGLHLNGRGYQEFVSLLRKHL